LTRVDDTDIEITAGTPEQLDPLAPLWKAMVDHHRHLDGHDLPVRGPDEAWSLRREEYQGWLADGSGRLLVARSQVAAAPRGYAFLRTVPSTPTFDFGGSRGEVESLVVAPDARGAGIGTALLEAARAELRRLGCTYWSVGVMEANHGAVQVYVRAGFRPWLRELAAPLDRRA
jgi:ribosomal protein S18 acetylase RimI-like enzyme